MKIPFRQGIVSAGTTGSQVPNFATFANGGFVNLNATQQPVVIAFAYKYHGDYLVEIRKDLANAWGPFNDATKTPYLYWDINFTNGALTYGSTLLAPVYSSTPPVSPQVDQHWFDVANKVMKSWSGSAWIERLRVFAATVSNANTLALSPFGSQAGLTDEVSAGFILFDATNSPIRTSEGYFFTTETGASAQFSPSTASIKIEQSVLVMEAVEPVVAFSLVAVAGPNKIQLADVNNDSKPAIGVVTSSLATGSSADVIFRGVINVPDWSSVLAGGASRFANSDIGKSVYLGSTGQFTLTRPANLRAQRIGVVINPTQMYLTFDSETIPYPAGGSANVSGSGPIVVASTSNGQVISISNATTTTDGSMTAADKVALGNVPAQISTETQARIAGDAAALPKAGGTMVGDLTLSGNPTNDLHAVPKQYVISTISSSNLDGGSF